MRSTEVKSEKALAEMWPAAWVVPQEAGELMVFGPLIAILQRSIDRTPDPGRPES